MLGHLSRALAGAVGVLAATAFSLISCGGHCTVDSLVGCGYESPGVQTVESAEGGSDSDGHEQILFDEAGVVIGIIQ